MRAFEVGSTCNITFADEDNDDLDVDPPITDEMGQTVPRKRSVWKATILPEIPNIDVPGNVTLLIYRSFNDERQIPSQPIGFSSDSVMVHAVLDAPELSPKRLVNSVDRAHKVVN